MDAKDKAQDIINLLRLKYTDDEISKEVVSFLKYLSKLDRYINRLEWEHNYYREAERMR